jgi:hypothetical protein
MHSEPAIRRPRNAGVFAAVAAHLSGDQEEREELSRSSHGLLCQRTELAVNLVHHRRGSTD